MANGQRVVGDLARSARVFGGGKLLAVPSLQIDLSIGCMTGGLYLITQQYNATRGLSCVFICSHNIISSNFIYHLISFVNCRFFVL